jgi:hypothetical protein
LVSAVLPSSLPCGCSYGFAFATLTIGPPGVISGELSDAVGFPVFGVMTDINYLYFRATSLKAGHYF